MFDLSKVPPHVLEEHCRVLYKSMREFFSNMTPEQEAAFLHWCAEYDRKHGLAPESEERGEI